ncbi:MAG: hypothetical protein LBD31_05225, partial [Treponema sp.]|nr:hypothetical protein [Treponema sp.]
MKKRWISAGLVVILAGAKLAAQPVISSVDFTGGQTGNLGIGDTVSLDITLAAPPAGTLTLVSGNLDSWTLGGLSGSGTAWTAVCTIANNGVQFVSGAMVPLANLVVNDVGGGGAGMAYAASIALPVGLTLDGKPPTGAVVSSSAATGGTPVTGYYNGTNTGSTLTVTFPNSSLDPSIDGGSLAVEVSDNGGGTWSALGSSAAIGAGVAAAGSITVNPGALAAYNGKTLQFRGILTDRAGNTGAAGAAGGSIVVDTTPPTLSTVTIASNNANTARAKVLNTVTVSITASEAVNTPAAGSQMVFSASRTGAALAIAGSGSSYTIAYTIVTGDLSLLTLGAAVPFSIAQITDPAGNVMAAPVTVITGGPVVMYYRGLTWQGAANGDWSTASNWAEGYAPPTADDEVVINSNNPRLTAAGAAKTITVGAGAGLDTDNFSLTVASTFTLSGTAWLRRRGGTTVPLPSGGTVIYHTGGLVQDYGAVVDYPSLEFTAGAYSLGAALTAGTLTVSGAASITGAFPLTVNGTSSLSADVSTAGNQTYTGAVTLGGAVTLAATGGAIVMAAITGGGNNLTLNSGAGTTTVSGNAAALGTVTLHGDSGTGAVTFSGGLTAAALSTTAAAYNLTLTGGGAVTITSAVTCTNTGTLTLNGTPNAITCTGGLTVSGPAGGVTVSGTVATAAAPMTLGAVTLGGTAVLNSGGGAISMAAITGGGNNLTLNSGTGTTTVSGAVSGLGSGTGAALTVGGTGLVTFDSTFTAASGIAASGGSLIFSGDVTLGNGNTGTTIGTTEIAGPAASFSGYDGVSLGNLTLSGTPRTVILNSNGGALAAGTITGGGNDLTLNSGAGTTTVSGNAAALGTVTLHSDSGTGAVTFSGGLTAAALSTTAAAYNLTLTGGGNPVTITTAVTCTNTGTLTLNGTPSAITCTGGLTATAPSGVTLSGTVQTAGGQPIVLGNLSPARNISLAGAAILDAGTGAATFYGGVSGAYNLTISGTGAATFNGAVSGVENLSVAGAGAINADISTTGSQTYTGAVTLGGSGTARTFSSGTNQDITFTGGVTGGSHNLSVIASGTGIVTFGGATTVGTGTPPAYAVDINAGMVRIAGGGSIASAGNLDIRFTADGYDLQPASTTVVAGGTGQVYYLFRDPGKTIEFGPTATASLPGLGAAADIFIDSDFFTTTRPVNIGGLSHQGNIWITVTTAAAAYDLTVGNAAGTGGSGRIGITAALAGLSTLTLNPGNTGVVVSGGGVTTTGNQTYNGKVTLGADADFSAGGGSLVRFASTVNSDSTARSLTVTAADVRFDDTAGTVLPY